MFISIFAILFLIIPAGPTSASETPGQNAIDAFVSLQEAGTNPALTKQINALTKDGYKQRGVTSAAVLGGGCGFAGCMSTFLVTTEYTTTGVNPQTKVVAAIVTSGIIKKSATVTRILSHQEITELLNPKSVR